MQMQIKIHNNFFGGDLTPQAKGEKSKNEMGLN